MPTKSYSDNNLTLNVEDDGHVIRVDWRGRSTARNPAIFLAPILRDALRQAGSSGQALVLDFTRIEYMHSSTITPIIRVLDEARRGAETVTVLYRAGLKWQELSFSALEIFQTEDHRIEIRGVE